MSADSIDHHFQLHSLMLYLMALAISIDVVAGRGCSALYAGTECVISVSALQSHQVRPDIRPMDNIKMSSMTLKVRCAAVSLGIWVFEFS